MLARAGECNFIPALFGPTEFSGAASCQDNVSLGGQCYVLVGKCVYEVVLFYVFYASGPNNKCFVNFHRCS